MHKVPCLHKRGKKGSWANVDHKRATLPTPPLLTQHGNMTQSTLPLTHIWTCTSINFCSQRHWEWQVNGDFHWLWQKKREKKSIEKKRRKALYREQWPQFRTHAAWGQLSPFFSPPPPPPSAKSPPARTSTGGKSQNGLCDTCIYYPTAVLLSETTRTVLATTRLEPQRCCLHKAQCE